MPDWNPAEIIGNSPRPLASSLYRELITEYAWCESRFQMGYRKFQHRDLMVTLANKPYVDVRSSFNSFLPGGVSDNVGAKLIDAWLDRLDAHPNFTISRI